MKNIIQTKRTMVTSRWLITIEKKEVIASDNCIRYWFKISGHSYIENGRYAMIIKPGKESYIFEDGGYIEPESFFHFTDLELSADYWN